MMILRWQRVPFCDADLVATTDTPVYSGVRCRRARRMLRIVSVVVILIQMLSVLVLRHTTSLLLVG
jgi:hypothetical protein